jgi:Fe-Mn family superoxide dismutase
MNAFHRRHILAGGSLAIATLAAPRVFAQAAAPAAAPSTPAGPFKLDPLPYGPDKNEPHIDARTMELHHGAHHRAYVNNLNTAAAQNAEWATKPLPELLGNLGALPENVRTLVRNNGGGHANHTMFWQIMGGSGGQPTGELADAITRDFTSLAKLQEDFNAAGGRVFGSGWVFVTVARDGKLALVTKPNQDTPLMDGQKPLMGNDVWEHAYYLKYQNRRPEYLRAWWNVVNWDKVAERYAAAKAGSLAI